MVLWLLLNSAASLFGQVDFATEVHPILAARCAACHTGSSAQAGLRIDERAGFVRVRGRLIAKVAMA